MLKLVSIIILFIMVDHLANLVFVNSLEHLKDILAADFSQNLPKVEDEEIDMAEISDIVREWTDLLGKDNINCKVTIDKCLKCEPDGE